MNHYRLKRIVKAVKFNGDNFYEIKGLVEDIAHINIRDNVVIINNKEIMYQCFSLKEFEWIVRDGVNLHKFDNISFNHHYEIIK